jgi:hypothetical protein
VIKLKDYPSEEDLEKIRKWPLSDVYNLIRFIDSVWNHEFGRIEIKGKKVITLKLITGGWSGNEDIVNALHKNENLFWSAFWVKSTRGGLFVFKIKEVD